MNRRDDSDPRRSVLKGPLLVTILLTSGCVSGPDHLDVSKTYPTLGSSQPTKKMETGLVVSTETFIDLNLGNPDDGAIVRHTGYTIYDDHGRWVESVRNYIGSRDSGPTPIELDPGRYLILLSKPEDQPSIFWVEVVPGKLTSVDLLKP
ncbi:MAG TPA: hypothetical protein VKW04_23340 [Planctomycetota bacterium]|nr:hypothetical protein [Planctomycetota bacterium]